MDIGEYTFSEFMEMARRFHGYPAPGLLIGAYMVEAAKRRLPEGTLFEAVVETRKCLPDAVQLLTLCSAGNNWMRVIPLGRYALSLYDKYTYEGWRVSVNLEKLTAYPEIYDWFFKRTPKKDQDTDRLFDEIETAGESFLSIRPVEVRAKAVQKKEMGAIAACPICKEAYPKKDGAICRGCQGENPYVDFNQAAHPPELPPELNAVPLEQAVGRRALHDMTRIVPGKSKGPAFTAGQELAGSDLCRLQQMGRLSVYAEDQRVDTGQWIHENDAVTAFAEKMTGDGVYYKAPPSEGKINFTAEIDGLLTIDRDMLYNFNLVPNVMCTSRQNKILVEKDKPFAGCRAIPLYLAREHFRHAVGVLNKNPSPMFAVHPLKVANVGILVTGTEIYRGLVQDKFEPVIRSKVEALGCTVIHATIVPDDADRIADAVHAMGDMGIDLLVTTAGLSVDPDDQTRRGLMAAGMTDVLYGAAVLPGAMTLIGRLGQMQLLGVPACALFHRITSLDLLLPRILAGQTISRSDLAEMAEGGFCLGCKSCTFPKCPFGK
ncbi:MAG: FmdE family protein [Thermodesulfobacteriota bacterium]